MATINNSILINETNHGFQKVGLLFDVGSVQGFGIALGLGLLPLLASLSSFSSSITSSTMLQKIGPSIS